MADRLALLERELELASCMEALERAIGGKGGFAVVEGPAGIGKTELLRSIRAQAAATGARVLAARGVEVERELPFGGARQLLEAVLRAVPPEEEARLLSGAATPARRLLTADARGSSPQADPAFAMLNALYWVLVRLADAQPLLLVVDDAHWLDRPSLRLLDFLVPRIDELSALVLVATRPLQEGEAPFVGRIVADPASHVIRLDSLSHAAVAKLVRARLGEDPAPSFVAACAEVTGGNPFYLGELLRELALRDTRPTSEEADGVRTIGPRSIALALRFRDASSSDATAIARALAVLGDGARLEQVAALAGLELDAAATATDTLTRAELFAPGPELSFAHPIVRTAVYGDLAPQERAVAHARAARVLHANGAEAERIAAHLLKTDAVAESWAVDVLRTAATTVLLQGAPEAAVEYLRRAIAETPSDAARADVLLELGRAEMSAAHPDAAAHLAEAYELARDVRTRAAAGSSAAYQLYNVGRASEAVAMLAAAVEELAPADPVIALELEAQLVSLAMYEPDTAERCLPRLDRFDEGLAADSTGARMMLCQLAYRRLWQSRNGSYAADLAERALADGLLLAERGAETPELTAAALPLIFAERLEYVDNLLDAALAHVRERGSRFGFAHVSFLRAELAYRRGALQAVEADARASLDITIPSRVVPGAAAATGILVAALIERGDLEEAADALDALWFTPDELTPQPPHNLLLCARGQLRIARGDISGGIDDLYECGRRNEQVGVRHPLLVPWRADAVLALRARDDLAAARALADEELAAAHDWGAPATIGAAQRLVAVATGGEEAIALLQGATAALADSPARLDYARALVDLGAALRRANRRMEARGPLRIAVDLAARCGATVLGERARNELSASGARLRRVAVSGIDALTPSERRVAEMAARGLGNIEIAQTLFVTRKTVEKHLSNAYTKLGVASRAELLGHFREPV